MRIAAFVLSLLLLFSTAFAVIAIAEPTNDILDADITQLRIEISAAETEAATYSGGAILALIQMRLETLKTTKAMLEQKRASWLRRISLAYTIDGKIFPPVEQSVLVSLEEDIAKQRNEIAKSEVEASQYSGGLLQSMLLLTTATQRSSLAFIEMRYFATKWGIPLYLSTEKSITNRDNPSSPGNIVKDKDAL